MKMQHDKLKSAKTLNVILVALICVVFILVYVLNRLFPLYSDDLLYSFVYNSEPLRKIGSFGDILQSQINHYLLWGGRSVVHTIGQFLLWVGVGWGDILNSLAYVAYVFIVYYTCNKRGGVKPLLFLFLMLVLWLFLPAPTTTILWITGSANYLWGTLIVLLFLFPYYSYYISDEYRNGWLRSVFLFLAGIIAGWTNENIFIAQVFFILCLFIYFRKTEKRIPIWAVTGLIGVCIGGTIMLLAPGNFIRSEVINSSLGLVDKSLVENILYRVGKVFYRYLIYVLPLVVLYFVILYIYVKKTNKANVDRKIIGGSLLFFLSGHVAWIVMSVSPIFPLRATFSIITFIVIGLGILYSNMNFDKTFYKRIHIGTLVILSIVFIVVYISEYKNIRAISTIFEQREIYIQQQKKENNRNIIFTNKVVVPDTYRFEDLSENPNNSVNKVYADYYGIDSVKIIQN